MPEGQENQVQGTDNKKLVVISSLVLGVLLLETVGVFCAVKMFGAGPSGSLADTLDGPSQQAREPQQTQEVPVAQLQCTHASTGRMYLIDISVSVTVLKEYVGSARRHVAGFGKDPGDSEQGIEKVLADNSAVIRDRMLTIVAQADANTLQLPNSRKPDFGLMTLRRQFKNVLEEICGKGKIREVLIPQYKPIPID